MTTRPQRPPHAPLTQRMGTGHWIAIDCVVAAFSALFVLISVRQAFMHTPRCGWRSRLLTAAGVFIPVALRRSAPVLAFGALLILAVLFGDMARGLMYPGAAITADSPDLPERCLRPLHGDRDQQQADRRGRARAGAGVAGVHRRHRARPQRGGARRARPGRAGQRPRLDDGVLGAAAPAVRGAVAAAGRDQRGRRRAAADRPGAARRGRAQHVGDRGAGRRWPVRHRRQPGRGPRGARRHPGHQQGSPRRDAPDARRAPPAGRHPDPGPGRRLAGGRRGRTRACHRRGRVVGRGRRSRCRRRLHAARASGDGAGCDEVPDGAGGDLARQAAVVGPGLGRGGSAPLAPARGWPTSTGSSSGPAARA